ncbi:MAG: hypothetical protein QOI95_2002 [Acidimicrobiaceae bacterium]|jgi:predicted TIM-barrel fold metal-dependent hydrolase
MTHAPDKDVALIRSQISHPVIDGDGHQLEFSPLVADFVAEIAGREVADQFEGLVTRVGLQRETATTGFSPVRAFFAFPSRNALDRMTATLPALLYDRLDQFGLDFVLLYPTLGIPVLTHPDEDFRVPVCRGLNEYNAAVYSEYRDRIEPVAVIPTFSPDEGIAALDHAVGELGLKAVVMSGVIPRAPRDGSRGTWVDSLGHNSVYDYDPLWRRCEELRVTPTFHGTAKGWGSHTSPTNYVYNHLGDFAAAQEAVCRSLVMGGVPRRFPALRFAFLEGGVAWALQLYRDVLGHYEKRNAEAVIEYDPAALDLSRCSELFEGYASDQMTRSWTRFEDTLKTTAVQEHATGLSFNDFEEAQIDGPEDIIDMFVDKFGFGCEADDPLNALAFDSRFLPNGRPLRAVFGSDIGHWDTTDMSRVLVEAWESVEHGHMGEDDFRAFTFGNAVELLTATNPDFFEGTSIEKQVRP